VPFEFTSHDATGVAELVRAREVSATAVLEAHLEQIERLDPALNAVWLMMEDRARREASAVDGALGRGEDPGPLAGVPVGWKDLIDTEGVRTTYGSRLFEHHVPARDADVVRTLSAAGAVNVAKLSLHELAWGTTNNNPHYGPCRNPYDLERVPGGSSGGSAAALAAELVALAPGTDTGGSIRCPASCCAIVGLKPTFGRVSLAGIHPLCISFDHCGPMARSVRDCALTLEVMAGPSPRDPRTPPVAVDRYTDALDRGVAGMVVGVIEPFFALSTVEIADTVRAAAAVLEDAGARLTELDLHWPPGPEGADFYWAEMAATLHEFWPQGRDLVGADIAHDVSVALELGAVDEAVARRSLLEFAGQARQRLVDADIDLLLSPTQPFRPPPIGRERVSFGGRTNIDVTAAMCALTEPFNMLGWPAISVPAGLDDGLPVGCQLVGHPWREADCLAAAAVIERAFPRQRPQLISHSCEHRS
jgi:aspartyl-tRNA(Asn)/glutamyl-tRNA(Gln) amidotransferase subunit A